ncbi:flagellar export chaperone FliS [Candidatus Uabimicrobium amorphum]|uniref:Flagellar protein FliS n=1 Tax=Uabimicrobium amorphum TaxID=2596890 RepID=A0A5S9F3S7_UABAM|nr:flagellar export chaperone FliS [Candidatus Uabimicrobium amorphum]BBM84996.1 flagellar protein FliS [Candidatus Uabimicrobium amorphum]
MYSGINQYKKIIVNTSSPVENIILLYKKSIQSLILAEQKLINEDYSAKGQAILKTIDIINLLNSNLDFSQGDVAKRLHEAYEIILAHLTKANTHNDLDSLRNAQKWLKDLLETWQQIARMV